MDDDELWLRPARRRRLRRRAGHLALLVAALAFIAAAQAGEGPPDPVATGAVVLLLALVVAGWWWLERRAGESPRRLLAARRNGSTAAADLAEDVAEARADHALRHGLPAPPGAQARVLARAEKKAADARTGVWLAPAYLVLGLFWASRADEDGWAVALAAVWVVLSVLLTARALRDRRVARRWLAAHGAEAGGR